jgi:hypothetical protein
MLRDKSQVHAVGGVCMAVKLKELQGQGRVELRDSGRVWR